MTFSTPSSPLSVPRDTDPGAWAHVLTNRARVSGEIKVQQVVELSAAVSMGGDALVRSLEELVGFVVGALSSAEVPYMVVGSFAGAYHGVPRSTQDLDIVVELDSDSLTTILKIFDDPVFYLSEAAVRQALQKRGVFHVIHSPTGWKIDFILRKNRAFSKREFSRRIRGRLLGREVYLATPEDTILAKLEWAKDGNWERQLREVAELIDVQGERLDREYLETGLDELELRQMMDMVKGPW